MNFNEFKTKLAEAAECELEFTTVNKSGESYEGMYAKGRHSAAVVNLNEFYEEFCKGRAMDELIRISNRILKMRAPELDADNLLKYESAKNAVIMRLLGSEGREMYLETVPHIVPAEGLAIVFSIEMWIRGERGLITVDNVLMKDWGVSLEELYETARKNSQLQAPLSFERIEDYLERSMNVIMEDEVPGLLIVSNSKNFLGAAALFYEGCMEKLSELLGGSYYIIPSSIHELIAIPSKGGPDPEAMIEMVKEVNSELVEKKDKLLDGLFYYDAEEKEFSRVN